MCLLNVHLDLGKPSFLTSPLRPNTAAAEQQTSQLSDLEAPVAPGWKQCSPPSVLQTEGPWKQCSPRLFCRRKDLVGTAPHAGGLPASHVASQALLIKQRV